MAERIQGVVEVPSQHAVRDTLDRLEALVRERGLLVFARIDFARDAANAGLTLRPMQALLFGSPRAGTPLLAAAPTSGLDLPLRALAWEAEDGSVRVAYDGPEWISARHGLPDALAGNLAAVHALVGEAASGGTAVAPRPPP